jgi:hypothetical protein
MLALGPQVQLSGICSVKHFNFKRGTKNSLKHTPPLCLLGSLPGRTVEH